MRQLIQTTPFPAFWLLLQPHDETAKGGCVSFSVVVVVVAATTISKEKQKMFTLTGTRTPPPGAPDEPERD
jgi:hypothetical protein